MLLFATPLVARLFDRFSQQIEIVIGALLGIFVAQLAMAAIWLGIMASALYWMLLTLALFCIAVAAMLPVQIDLASLLTVGWGCLTFTLPYALVRVAGFRIERFAHGHASTPNSESIQFPLSRLFAWTFVVAALLAVYQWVPAAVARPLATSLSFIAVASVGLATLWAVLWPGPLRRWLALAPFGVLTVVVLYAQKSFGWGSEEIAAIVSGGVLFIATLAGLMAIYRRAGMRLVAKSGRGWLVR